MVKLDDLVQEDERIAVFAVTGSYCEYRCIIGKNSDDISSAFEDTLHRILDAGGSLDDVCFILGARIPTEEEWAELKEYDEYTEIDLGYVIPGLITSFRK